MKKRQLRKTDTAANIMSTKPMQAAMAVVKAGQKSLDPLGSYTGVPTNPNEIPVQDVDDL